jgi:trigger factor
MQVTVEKLSPVLVEFQVEVPAERVKDEVDRAMVALQRTARVRGFRPGKAPRNVLTHIYGGRVYADVAQRLVDSTLNKALEDKQVQPLSQPAIAPNELKPEAAFSYKARFEVRPDIESVKWEGFEVKRPKAEASDAAIDAEIERLRLEHATLQAPEPARPAKKGDMVRIAFTLEVADGPKETGGEQEIETEVGSGQVFSEIDGALEGASVDEKKDVAVSFSERHANAELRGKTGTFHITVKDIKERIPVPPSLVEQQAQMTERELVQNARRQGQRLDVNADLRQRVRLDAELKVRAGLLMAEIAKAKQVKIDDSDIEKGYAELAEQTGKNVAKVKAEYRDPKKREMLVGMILEDKILDLIEGAAKVQVDET